MRQKEDRWFVNENNKNNNFNNRNTSRIVLHDVGFVCNIGIFKIYSLGAL